MAISLPIFTFTMRELQERMRAYVYRPGRSTETEQRNEEHALLIGFSNWLSSHPSTEVDWQTDHAYRWEALNQLGWFGEEPKCAKKKGEIGIRMVQASTGAWTEFHLNPEGLSFQAIHTNLLEACERYITTLPTTPR
jgi:hypothetical protein